MTPSTLSRIFNILRLQQKPYSWATICKLLRKPVWNWLKTSLNRQPDRIIRIRLTMLSKPVAV